MSQRIDPTTAPRFKRAAPLTSNRRRRLHEFHVRQRDYGSPPPSCDIIGLVASPYRIGAQDYGIRIGVARLACRRIEGSRFNLQIQRFHADSKVPGSNCVSPHLAPFTHFSGQAIFNTSVGRLRRRRTARTINRKGRGRNDVRDVDVNRPRPFFPLCPTAFAWATTKPAR